MIDTATETRCKNPKCRKPVHQIPGPHRPKEYCNDTCKETAYRLRKKGITDDSVMVVDESTKQRIAELEAELARYRAIVDVSDRQAMIAQFMLVGEEIGYKPLSSVDVRLGPHAWYAFSQTADTEHLGAAIVAAKNVYKQLADLQTTKEVAVLNNLVTDLRQKLRECEKRKQP